MIVGSVVRGDPVTVPPSPGVPSSGPSQTTQSSADWGKLGFDGPTASAADVTVLPGDPRVLQQVVDDFTYLRDVAGSVSQGLDAFVAAASSGGFEGAAADALREVVSGRLKAFVFNIARAFALAGEAVAQYRGVLVAAQRAAAD